MSGGTFYDMGSGDWFFLPNDGSTGSFFESGDPVDLNVYDDVKPPGYEPEPDGIDWSAALDAYFKDKGM